ncbi:protease modulator HflC [Jannaschia aquimarina]|uniref:Protein HflC n=1 Tax=Jannaschia aquimarina TaxID=935700 RepID=A0A0D1DCI4_9RHOB|nr:protease modulator HflC [Jannaschia aquimarina]KIT17693.1 Modulator of FtsH protease HflC [Jannaschia aquimarina]SNS78896.1 protease FtsH subunit HflC [Jannaschia aquimarina]
MKRSAFLLPIAAVALLLAFTSLFVVDERQKALVLQFGRVVNVKEDPGLAFKLPFIQNVVFYDDRILSLDVDPIEVTPSDDRRLVVDAFARFRIADVVQFRNSVGAAGIMNAERLIDDILRDELRAVLGTVSSNEILSEDRAALMARIASGARDEASDLGIFVLDVRLKRTDLPPQNLDATFARMRAEREREAADEIARGEEAAQRIRAQADRTVVELTSDARREAEITRGVADAERNRIFANAFTADPEFFEFYRSLTAYERAIRADNSTMVLSPDSEFFSYLKTARSSEANPPAPEEVPTPEELMEDIEQPQEIEEGSISGDDDASAVAEEGTTLGN